MLDSSGLGVSNNPFGVCKTKITPYDANLRSRNPESLTLHQLALFPLSSDIQHGHPALHPVLTEVSTGYLHMSSYFMLT